MYQFNQKYNLKHIIKLIHHQIGTFSNRYIISLFHYFIISLSITSCAVVSSPTGGERDTTPPKILAELPQNKTTNFKAKEINIAFDEFIQLQNSQNIIITPDINPKPIFTAKRKELNIKFKTDLDTNTTYTIFFGNELKDNNEGNPTDNYTYVFSTGNYLDSLSLQGNIQNYEDKMPQNAFVVVYKNLSDTAFTTQRPYYISRVQPNGSFKLDNLKQDTYQIYALADNNNNYYYDLPTEQVGFLSENIQLDSNISDITIPFFLSEETKFRILEKDRNIQNGIFNTTWNKTFSPKEDQFEIETSDSEIKAIAFPDEKSLKIYFPNLKSDTGTLQFFVKHNGTIIDSITTKITKSKTQLLFFDTIQHKDLKILQSQTLVLSSNQYSISDIDTNKIYIIDTSENKIPFFIEQQNDFKTYNIKAKFLNQLYKIIIQDSCFQDLSGNFNKSQEISFLVDEDKKGGNLLINIELDTVFPSLIFLLKNNQDKVLKKEILRDSQAFKFNIGLIQNGSYKIEIIKDDNQNEIWNSGNFLKKTLPEKIYKHATPILVKENWDSEETIKPNFEQVKNSIQPKNLEENPENNKPLQNNLQNPFLNNRR